MGADASKMHDWGLRSVAGGSKWVLVADTGCWWLDRGIGGQRTGAGGWKAVRSDLEWWKGGAGVVIHGAGGLKRVLVGGWWVKNECWWVGNGCVSKRVLGGGQQGAGGSKLVLVAHVRAKAGGNSKKNTPRVEIVLVA